MAAETKAAVILEISISKIDGSNKKNTSTDTYIISIYI